MWPGSLFDFVSNVYKHNDHASGPNRVWLHGFVSCLQLCKVVTIATNMYMQLPCVKRKKTLALHAVVFGSFRTLD